MNLDQVSTIEAIVEHTIIESDTAFRHLPGAELRQERYALLMKTNRRSALLNGIFNSRFPPRTAARLIRQYIETFQLEGLPFTYLLTPSSRPLGLEKILDRSGLVCDDQSCGMALDLQEWNPQKHTPHIPGLSVRLIDSRQAREHWFQVLQDGFDESDVFIDALRQLYAFLDIYEPITNFHYLGEIDGQAVATITLCMSNRVASIFDVSTLPRFRRRGIGSAMTCHALSAAQQMDGWLAVLESSEMGKSVYQSAGFREHGRYLYYTG